MLRTTRNPGTHGMRVVLSIVFHRTCGATIGVAFAQNWVHRRTFDRIIFGTDRLFLIGLRIFWIIRQAVAFALQFGDGANELWHRGRNIWQFDHIGVWCFYQSAEFRQII